MHIYVLVNKVFCRFFSVIFPTLSSLYSVYGHRTCVCVCMIKGNQALA